VSPAASAEQAFGPALGLLELESIARGYVVADALVKHARVRLAISEAVTPGKYLLLFVGPIAEVEESFAVGRALGGAQVLDALLLPQLAGVVQRALGGAFEQRDPQAALGLLEAHTVAATLLACDTAVKRAQVRLHHLHLARGVGGKGWFLISGALHDVEAALEGATAALAPHLLVAAELIQRPHGELKGPGL
jgi:microcompartment protein CcmL/EutN